MKRYLKNTARFLFVTVGIIVLTSFTIDATDTLRGSQSALSLLAKRATQGTCPAGMVAISLGERSFCMDVYENSVGDTCPASRVGSILNTKTNLAQSECVSVSEPAVYPWTYVTFHQAKELCAKRGMRLPSSDEWYEGVLGTPVDGVCNIDGGLEVSGDKATCVSARGVHDLVGNVWEWVDAEVTDGVFEDRILPEEGYVAEVDTHGVATETTERPSELYDRDYFWSSNAGTYAMMRGGYHGSGADAGLYTIHAETAPSFSSQAIGFRCVKDL